MPLSCEGEGREFYKDFVFGVGIIGTDCTDFSDRGGGWVYVTTM